MYPLGGSFDTSDNFSWLIIWKKISGHMFFDFLCKNEFSSVAQSCLLGFIFEYNLIYFTRVWFNIVSAFLAVQFLRCLKIFLFTFLRDIWLRLRFGHIKLQSSLLDDASIHVLALAYWVLRTRFLKNMQTQFFYKF